MKLFVAALALVLMTGCASQSQKDERMYLKEMHRAEHIIASGKTDIAVGTAIVEGGTTKVLEGELKYEEAKAKLESSI